MHTFWFQRSLREDELHEIQLIIFWSTMGSSLSHVTRRNSHEIPSLDIRRRHLPDYVEEKTQGAIPADQVERFLLSDVRGDCSERLAHLNIDRVPFW
jgi:hypothetical protein